MVFYDQQITDLSSNLATTETTYENAIAICGLSSVSFINELCFAIAGYSINR